MKGAFTIAPAIGHGMESAVWLWHRAAMTPTPRAGGCFLTAAILVGLGAGIALGSPILGVLAGALTGALLALAIWVVDRRRGPQGP